MLKELYIENLAVISRAEISFSGSFNVFTGETGAGKSILINGINAVLGQRVTRDIVRTGCQKAVISALFTELDAVICTRLSELDIACPDGEILLTREISADGGSVARVNSRVSSVSVLREIGEMLINIHGQHDNQILLAPERHLSVLEAFGGDDSLLEDYREAFRALQKTAKELKILLLAEKDKEKRIAALSEAVSDIGELDLDPDKDLAIDGELEAAADSEALCAMLGTVRGYIDSGDDSAVNLLCFAENELERYCDDEALKTLHERISSARLELSDVSGELYDMLRRVDIDPQRLERLRARRNQIRRVERIYGEDTAGLIALYEKSAEELQQLSSSADEIQRLSDERVRLLALATEKAKALSAYRMRLAEEFCARVCSELKFLDMPGVRLEVAHHKGKLTANGMDTMEFLISANAGEPPKPIAKIASGGELSRIMLALKSVIADKDSIPTLIFDEIDTGVSGRAAQKIGVKLRQIGAKRQVLCVTHLAQIAVMADSHMLIEKKTLGERTVTEVTPLDFEHRKLEIARIMGGANPSALMLKNAEEQLLDAQKYDYT